jgi:hypothetical protein
MPESRTGVRKPVPFISMENRLLGTDTTGKPEVQSVQVSLRRNI